MLLCTCMCLCVCVRAHIHMCVCVRVCGCVHTYVCLCTCMCGIHIYIKKYQWYRSYITHTDSEAIKARALANVQSAFSNQETNQKSFISITTNDLQETCKSLNNTIYGTKFLWGKHWWIWQIFSHFTILQQLFDPSCQNLLVKFFLVPVCQIFVPYSIELLMIITSLMCIYMWTPGGQAYHTHTSWVEQLVCTWLNNMIDDLIRKLYHW